MQMPPALQRQFDTLQRYTKSQLAANVLLTRIALCGDCSVILFLKVSRSVSGLSFVLRLTVPMWRMHGFYWLCTCTC